MTPEFAQRLAAAQSSLYAFIVPLMGGRDEAADVLQETNLKLYREFHRYDKSKPFINWALTLARFEVMAWRTRQSRSRLVLENDVAERVAAALHTGAWDPALELAALERCLQKLPDRQRARLRVWRWCGWAAAALVMLAVTFTRGAEPEKER